MALVPFVGGTVAPTVAALAPYVGGALSNAAAPLLASAGDMLAKRVRRAVADQATSMASGFVQRTIPDYFGSGGPAKRAFGASFGRAPVPMYSNAGVFMLKRGRARLYRGSRTLRAVRRRYIRRRRWRRYNRRRW